MVDDTNFPANVFLNQPIPVLDKGFVRLVDYMGGDDAIVQAARVSYGKGTKSVREDANLIDYLVRHAHTSPLEQVVLKFHLKLPLFVAQQLIRHRTASLNQRSARYSEMLDEYYIPSPERVQGQSSTNKQGSDDTLPEDVCQHFVDVVESTTESMHHHYARALQRGVARELARVTLPANLYTEMYWQMDLHNLFHFLRLRLDSHAQWEIQEYARAIAQCAQVVAPVAYDAFERHRLNAITLSSDELEIVRKTTDAHMLKARLEQSSLRKSRQRELLAKLGFTDE